MCECGCTMNDKRYTFAGPGKVIYMLTLSGGCVDCDAPSGISIERLKPGDFMHANGHRDEFVDGELQFETWAESEGVGIVTGMRRHEFVKALSAHLIGASAEEMGENGVIDEAGAEVMLEEMFEDAQMRPAIVAPVTKDSEA